MRPSRLGASDALAPPCASLLQVDGWIELLTRLRHRRRSSMPALPASGAAITAPAAAVAAGASAGPPQLPACRTSVDLIEFYCPVGFEFEDRAAAIMAAAPSFANLPVPVGAGEAAGGCTAGPTSASDAAPRESATALPPAIRLTRLVARAGGESRVEVQCPRLAAWLQLRR